LGPRHLFLLLAFSKIGLIQPPSPNPIRNPGVPSFRGPNIPSHFLFPFQKFALPVFSFRALLGVFFLMPRNHYLFRISSKSFFLIFPPSLSTPFFFSTSSSLKPAILNFPLFYFRVFLFFPRQGAFFGAFRSFYCSPVVPAPSSLYLVQVHCFSFASPVNSIFIALLARVLRFPSSFIKTRYMIVTSPSLSPIASL